MKKMSSFILILFISITTHAQTEITTPTSTPSLKDRIAGKWLYKGTEEFAVFTAADSTQKNDYIEISPDGNYLIVVRGKQETGTYKLVEAYKQIYFSSSTTKKTKMFTIKSSVNGKLTLDFQTPDLIHTKYQYEITK